MTNPDIDTIQRLHRKYAPSEAAFELVYTHCQIVWELAQQLIMASDIDVNAEFVKSACLLHDIGVYRLYMPNGEIDHKNYISHGVHGHEILKVEGFDPAICRIASCHIGVGLKSQEIIDEGLPLPPADYEAQTKEEHLVMYADKFHTKTTPPTFMTAQTYAQQLAKRAAYKGERFRQLISEFGEPDLKPLAKKYDLEIV